MAAKVWTMRLSDRERRLILAYYAASPKGCRAINGLAPYLVPLNRRANRQKAVR